MECKIVRQMHCFSEDSPMNLDKFFDEIADLSRDMTDIKITLRTDVTYCYCYENCSCSHVGSPYIEIQGLVIQEDENEKH